MVAPSKKGEIQRGVLLLKINDDVNVARLGISNRSTPLSDEL